MQYERVAINEETNNKKGVNITSIFMVLVFVVLLLQLIFFVVASVVILKSGTSHLLFSLSDF